MALCLDELCRNNTYVLLDTSVLNNDNDKDLSHADIVVLKKVFGGSHKAISIDDQLRYKRQLIKVLHDHENIYFPWQIVGELRNVQQAWKGKKLAPLRYQHDAFLKEVDKKILENKIRTLPDKESFYALQSVLECRLRNFQDTFGLSQPDYKLLLFSFTLSTLSGSVGLATNDMDLTKGVCESFAYITEKQPTKTIPEPKFPMKVYSIKNEEVALYKELVKIPSDSQCEVPKTH